MSGDDPRTATAEIATAKAPDAKHAAIDASGLRPADVVQVRTSPAGMAVITNKTHAIADPGDALPVSVQCGDAGWVPHHDSPE